MNRIESFAEATGAFDPRTYNQPQQGQGQPQGSPNPPKGQQGKGSRSIKTGSGTIIRMD
jgi:hypothetical protein